MGVSVLKSCGTCKHLYGPVSSDPCSSCLSMTAKFDPLGKNRQFHLWEPANSAVDDSAVELQTTSPLVDQPEAPTLLDKFDAEIATITQRRGDIYGHPADDFAVAARLMAEFDHVDPPQVRHALRMICVKLARLANTPGHLDSYIDIAGYARTAVMCLDRTK